MPYYAWRGINLKGELKKGRLFAQSVQALDDQLFKRDIAVLTSFVVRPAIIGSPIKQEHKIAFFRQLSVLLSAGVLLPEALNIINGQINHRQFQELLHDIARNVHHGASLSQALHKYEHVFDPFMIQMVYVGQEAGTLATTLSMIADYVQERQQFVKQVRSATLMPLVTLIFFGVIAAVIFSMIIPRFAALFASAHQQLPPLTQAFIAISAALNGYTMLIIGAGFIAVYAALKLYMQSTQGAKKRDRLYSNFPYIGTLIHKSNAIFFLRSLALLLASGMPLLAAVRMSKKSITNLDLQESIAGIELEIASGTALSDAMAQCCEKLFGPEVIAMVYVGQESGQLSAMLVRAADEYDRDVKRKLLTMTTLIQPILMVVLGLLVALLIFAVYLPIFNMSQTASF